MEVDLPLEQLEQFRYLVDEPDDFDDFWQETLEVHASTPLDLRIDPVDAELRTVDTFDLTFRGYGGTPVRAWLLLPRARTELLPVIIEYLGYGVGRGHPVESLAYSAAGFGHLILDTRGQGSEWRAGETEDGFGSPPSIPGFVTRGILEPSRYYYRRLYVDAYRAVDVAKSIDVLDHERITVTGRSQGGALSLVVAGLRTDIALAVPHVPFLCAIQRAITVTDADPYGELVRWLAIHRTRDAEALANIAYFDAVSFARRARCPARFSVALHDAVCPPSTVYAAYNDYGGPRHMTIWHYNKHEAGGPEDILRTIRAARGAAVTG